MSLHLKKNEDTPVSLKELIERKEHGLSIWYKKEGKRPKMLRFHLYICKVLRPDEFRLVKRKQGCVPKRRLGSRKRPPKIPYF